MYHRTPLPADLLCGSERPRRERRSRRSLDAARRPSTAPRSSCISRDGSSLRGPRRFLPETNTRWFSNLVTAAIEAKVQRIILTSFPQVEGPTSVEQPATGRLDRQPISVHARTRLEEERLLFERTKQSATTPVVLRLGDDLRARHSDGRGRALAGAPAPALRVARADAAFSCCRTADFLRAAEAAIVKPGIHGIYHVGDEQPVTVQRISRRSVPRVGLSGARCGCRIRSSTRRHVCAKASRRSRASPRRSRATSCGWGACRTGAIRGARARN